MAVYSTGIHWMAYPIVKCRVSNDQRDVLKYSFFSKFPINVHKGVRVISYFSAVHFTAISSPTLLKAEFYLNVFRFKSTLMLFGTVEQFSSMV